MLFYSSVQKQKYLIWKFVQILHRGLCAIGNSFQCAYLQCGEILWYLLPDPEPSGAAAAACLYPACPAHQVSHHSPFTELQVIRVRRLHYILLRTVSNGFKIIKQKKQTTCLKDCLKQVFQKCPDVFRSNFRVFPFPTITKSVSAVY